MNFEISEKGVTTKDCEMAVIRRPLTGAERVAKMREKERLVRDGKYVASPLEQAKEFLAEMQEPDLGKLSENPALFKSLNDDDMMRLKVYLKNLKAKTSKTRAMLS